MRRIFFLCTALTISIFLSKTLNAESQKLIIYAPDYFASEWGPGPAIEKAFEKECSCDLIFKTGDILPRLLLEGKNTKADVVLGLNTDITKKARETGLFADHEQDLTKLELPLAWNDTIFLPFDYSHIAFVYDANRLKHPPASFEDLINSKEKIKLVIQDPRSSISGLALVLWVKSIYGDDAGKVWEKLSSKILTVTKGWSEAYGLFTEGEADMVLSFSTSPAYHIVAEGDMSKKAAIFPEGHYFFVELAAKIKNAENPALADAFLSFILTDNFQNLIPEGNWSFPAAQSFSRWPKEFQELPIPKKVLFFSEEEAAKIRDEAIEEWRRALSK